MSFRSMVMLGLSLALDSEAHRRTKKIKPVTFKGKGKTPAFQNAGWSAIRDAAYGTPEA
ncbi:MAG: hypothetical protein FWG50_06495 [Kiritimatiellaeota bacterium]|nr:hypothetical protein [Kiritimatiellota bacterium]